MQMDSVAKRTEPIQQSENFITASPTVGKEQNFVILPFPVQVIQLAHQLLFIMLQMHQPGHDVPTHLVGQEDGIRRTAQKSAHLPGIGKGGG
ncbi:MAG: hypothetical protein D3908_10750 [Candidatus Electrothrix sp. AUS4]|nr:hypothetical protein [Candidatus Electrothrix sp. AUS4]